MTYVDESEVPLPHRKGKEWDELFKNIPKGKALVITEPTPMAVRHALYRRQKRGQFKDFICVERNGVAYVVNPKEKAK